LEKVQKVTTHLKIGEIIQSRCLVRVKLSARQDFNGFKMITFLLQSVGNNSIKTYENERKKIPGFPSAHLNGIRFFMLPTAGKKPYPLPWGYHNDGR
jgi:hypothetical protein